MRFVTDGLIIREQYTGESDRIVTVLTRDNGLLRAFVTGARSMKSKNISSTQLLCYSHIEFLNRKDTYRITESSPIEIFFGLRSDIEKLALAQYFCEVSRYFVPEGDNAEEYLRLALNSLKFLADSSRSPMLLKSIFELRILSISGYMPDLTSCSQCGSFECDIFYFDAINGEVFCNNCRPALQPTLLIPASVFAAMRHIIYSDFSKLFSFKLEDSAVTYISDAAEKYMLAQSGLHFVTLDFLNSIPK